MRRRSVTNGRVLLRLGMGRRGLVRAMISDAAGREAGHQSRIAFDRFACSEKVERSFSRCIHYCTIPLRNPEVVVNVKQPAAVVVSPITISVLMVAPGPGE